MVIIFLLLGIIFGSFINAWVWRTEKDMPISKGRSMCTHCGHELAWYDLVPLVSYLQLKGKCRYCKNPIGKQYPVVEAITGLLFVLVYLSLASAGVIFWVYLFILLAITVLLVAAFVYDAKHMQLPEKYMLPAVVLGVVYIGLKTYELGWISMYAQIVSLGLVLLFYISLWYFSKGRWLGSGDIRIVAVMGLILDPKQLLVGLFFAYLVGALYGIYIISKYKKKRGIRVPFGPFLIIGFYVGLLAGTGIANWYLALL